MNGFKCQEYIAAVFVLQCNVSKRWNIQHTHTHTPVKYWSPSWSLVCVTHVLCCSSVTQKVLFFFLLPIMDDACVLLLSAPALPFVTEHGRRHVLIDLVVLYDPRWMQATDTHQQYVTPELKLWKSEASTLQGLKSALDSSGVLLVCHCELHLWEMEWHPLPSVHQRPWVKGGVKKKKNQRRDWDWLHPKLE